MEDSIINIDECDSFSLSSDTDIKCIVDQWKCRDSNSTSKDVKQFDTRTFTRPKKRLFSGLNGNITKDNVSNEESSDDQATTSKTTVPQIDLKIGGLVTSMQRSYLGDVSPPVNMDSSIEPMENSLITSMDFSNVDEFINGNEGSLSMAHFNQYRLSDAINDRNFLERLTNYDESLFTKDADINNIDGNHLISNGTLSSNSTLQNSTDSTKNDETFKGTGQMNGTFDAVGEVNRTFIAAPNENETNNSVKNETFDLMTKNNGTFELMSTTRDIIKIPDCLEDEELSLYGSLKDDDAVEFKRPDAIGLANVTITHSPQVDLNSTVSRNEIKDYQSTPARRDVKKGNQNVSIGNISPIFGDDLKQQMLTHNVDKFVDVEIEDFPSLMRTSPPRFTERQISNPTGINVELREKERRSLANFEEFENTLLILENKNEEEFDDLLNTFTANNFRNPLSQKVQQSLENIKKRHSLLAMEKQQHDELNREKTLNLSQNDKNRLNESFNRSAMISSTSSNGSGSGERLLRRSRLFDDVIHTSGSSGVDNNGLHTSSSGSSIGLNDNRQATEHNTTEILNRKNQSHFDSEISQLKTDQTIIYNTDEIKNESKSNHHRDRFKTIRIFKKPPEDAIQVPDADEDVQITPQNRTLEAFATKNTNSPLKLSQTNQYEETFDQNTANKRAIDTKTFKRSALARPKQLGGLYKRDLYAKSSSHELLLSDDQTNQYSKVPSKQVPQLKSPMGVKSKSIHNLNTTKNSVVAPTRTNTQLTANNTFKLPATRSLATMRQPTAGQPKKLTLIRPSSGYYGYNTKRADSDNESAKFSSNNSLSSGSSKSSMSRGETPETYNASNENPNATFVQPSVPSRSNEIPNTSKIGQPKLSLLRPPTQIRRSALPRPTTFTKR